MSTIQNRTNESTNTSGSVSSGYSLNPEQNMKGEAREYTLYEEVAAILEYEGGYTRQEAERLARIRAFAPPEVPFLLLLLCNHRLVMNKERLGLGSIADSLLFASMLGVDESDQFYVPQFGDSAKCIAYERRSRQAVDKYLTAISLKEQHESRLIQQKINKLTQSKAQP